MHGIPDQSAIKQGSSQSDHRRAAAGAAARPGRRRRTADPLVSRSGIGRARAPCHRRGRPGRRPARASDRTARRDSARLSPGRFTGPGPAPRCSSPRAADTGGRHDGVSQPGIAPLCLRFVSAVCWRSRSTCSRSSECCWTCARRRTKKEHRNLPQPGELVPHAPAETSAHVSRRRPLSRSASSVLVERSAGTSRGILHSVECFVAPGRRAAAQVTVIPLPPNGTHVALPGVEARDGHQRPTARRASCSGPWRG